MLASIAAADPPAGENVQLANVANGVLNVRVRIVLVAGAEPVVRLMPPTLSLLPAKSVKVGPVPAPVLALRVGVPPSDAQAAILFLFQLMPGIAPHSQMFLRAETRW